MNRFECALGYHEYVRTKDKRHPTWLKVCKHCKRKGIYGGYNEDNYKEEYILDDEGTLIYSEDTNGIKWWKDNDDEHWIGRKPKNWKYEKFM